VADDESNAGKAGKAVERLIKVDKVDMLLGGFAAPFGVIPGCITAEKYKKYYHTTICLIPPWLEKHFKWSTLYFFDLGQACAVPFQIWEKVPEAVRPKKPAPLMEDTFDGRAFAGIFRDQAKKFGYNFVLDEPLAVGSKDYSAQILKAKNLGVDSILIFTSDSDCITFVRQMKEANLSVVYMHGWKGTWAGEFWKALGKDAQYILCDGFWSMDFPFPGAKELGERYYKDFGKYSVSVGATYALCQILFQAIEKAGTVDGAKVRQAVLENKFETVMGPVKYGPDGVAVFTSTASQWWDGKQMTVYPFEWTKYQVKLAPPWQDRK
jgi:branched-chain amino acid transport system substrate-binding protein